MTASFAASLAAGLAAALAAVPTPVRLTADVDDAYSLRVNPAGLGYLEGAELRLLYGRTPVAGQSGSIDGFGVFGAFSLGQALTLGGSYSIEAGPGGATRDRTTLGLGLGLGQLTFGLSWDHRSDFGGEGGAFVSLGSAWRPTDWFAAGVMIRDLAQRTQRRDYDLGLALRPHERFILSSRWRLVQGRGLSGDTLDLAFLASVEPFDGVHLGAAAAFPRGFGDHGGGLDYSLTAQLALALENTGVGASIQNLNDDPILSTELFFRTARRPGLARGASVAVLDLEGDLVPDPSFDLFARGFLVSPYGAAPLLLGRLSRADGVAGVLLRIGSLNIGWSKAEELRRGILALKAEGRRVDCQLASSGDLPYYLASACHQIIVTPPMSLNVNGIAASSLFLGEALRELGVDVDVARRGAYKSAPEQLTRRDMSREQEESLSAYLDTVYGALLDGIASGRGLSRAEVEGIVARGTVTSSEARSLKLVDAILYPDQVEEHLRSVYGGGVAFRSPRSALPAERLRWGDAPRIAVLHVDAAITGGQSSDLPLGLGRTSGAQTLMAALEYVRTSPGIRALVIRVDSPGGDAVASDLINRAVERVAAVKPVVASFGDVAASGGYYVAAPAQVILAESTSLTGSIGVFSVTVSVEQLLARLGIHSAVIKRGELSNAGNLFHDPTDAERAVTEAQVEHLYRVFLEAVARGRKMEVEEVRKVAEGRIFSGADARAAGLVDELGGLEDAIYRARALAGLEPGEEVTLETLPTTRRGLPEALRRMALALTGSAAVDPLLSALPPAVREAVGAAVTQALLSSGGAPLALAPWILRPQ